MTVGSFKFWCTKGCVFAVCSIGAAACTQPESTSQYVACDTQISASADSLLQVMGEDYGLYTRFGHQDATVYGHTWWDEDGRSDVLETAGHYPAVYGWELGNIEHADSYSIDSVSFDTMRQHIILADQRGGINTISWHLDNPMNGHSSWDKTPGTVQAILNNPIVRAKYIKGVNNLATFLLSLKRDDGSLIPILFRPFHEHSGSWFWWGKAFCSPEEYVALWTLTQKTLQELGLHNILYMYSPDYVDTIDDYLERYPGDDCVDILGLDYYHRNGAEGARAYMMNAKKMLHFVAAAAQAKNKLHVFSETGSESLPMDHWFTQVLAPIIEATHPAYVLVWRNAYDKPMHHYAPYVGHPAAEDFKTFCTRTDILMGARVLEK